MVSYWLYVSESLLWTESASEALAEIVTASSARNATLEVTGGLLYTGKYFAQMIEGPERSVEDLRTSISRDHRHTMVKTLARSEWPRRRFPKWSLAYIGPSIYLNRAMATALAQDKAGVIDQISSLLVELSG